VWRARERGVFWSGEGPAYEAWKSWRSDARGVPMALVRAAILAANPHNTQPWLFRVSSSRIDVLANTKRNIGMIDPFLREMHTGVGCAIENLVLAAEANALSAQVALSPNPGDLAHVARIDLTPAPAKESFLYRAIPQRHTNRGPYRIDAPIAEGTFAALSALSDDDPELRVIWLVRPEARAALGKLIVQATEAIISDRAQSQDSAKWYRLEWSALQKHRDGITVDAMGAGALVRAGAKWLPPLSMEQNDRFWLSTTRDVHVATAAAFGVLAIRSFDDISQRLRAGRLWQRMHLWATAHGLALQPLNQIPERIGREQITKSAPRFADALRQLHGERDWQPLMLFRAGYPTQPALPSPRRALETVLI
jgi:nitroreductase